MTDTTELVKVEALNAVQIFTGGGLNMVLDQIESTVRAIPLDPSTKDGREEIRSVAYRVIRTKTALDAEGKRLTEEWRKNTAKVNEERKKSIERLDALAEEVRKPLTDFENKEKIRVAAHEEALNEISGLLSMLQSGGVLAEAPASLLEEHLADFQELHKDREWEEFTDRAAKVRHQVNATLIHKIEARKKFDADQAELARLRQAELERIQRERDERLQAEAAEKARLEAERKAQEAAEAERQRVAAEVEAERQRVAAEAEKVRLEHERVKKEAEAKLAKEKAARAAAEALAEQKRAQEENARLAAEKRAEEADSARIAAAKKAEAEKRAAEAKAAAELKAAQEKAKRDAEAAAQREREKIERERKAAEIEAKRREADKANKTKIRIEIIEDLSGFILPAGDAEQIADALMAGKIRNVRVVF